MKATVSLIILSLFTGIQAPAGAATGNRHDASPVPARVRLLDLDGDGRLDRLIIARDGSLTVELNRGARVFEEIRQELPSVLVSDALVADLDGDGHRDLYLVSPRANSALVGDGAGMFVESTRALGLADPGDGVSAEHVDVDADGQLDVLLHNREGDVVFWGTPPGMYERDPSTPSVESDVPGAVVVEAPGAVRPPAGRANPMPPAASAAPERDVEGVAPDVPVTAVGGSRTSLTSGAVELGGFCAGSIEDQSTGDCITASSMPVLGNLHPLSQDFNIDTDGNVGIGTTSLSHKLTVAGPVRSFEEFHAGYGSTVDPAFRFGGGSEHTGLSSAYVNTLSLLTSGVERMRLTESGNIGVNNTSPVRELDVTGEIGAVSDSSSSAVYGQTTGSGTAVSGYTQSATGRAASFQIYNSGNDQTALAATTNGTGQAALFSITNSSSTDPAVTAATTGNGVGLGAYAYGNGDGVSVLAFGAGDAVSGEQWSGTGGSAARFEIVSATNNSPGVLISSAGRGNGLEVHTSRTNLSGIRSIATGALTYGIYGQSPNIGVVGATTDPDSIAVLALGHLSASGNKYFVQPHPTDAGKQINFVALEGNEAGTFFRGTAQLVEGRTVIAVPAAFRWVSEAEGLSTQLTPVGARASLWIEAQDLEQLVVRGDADVEFHYLVNGVRRGYAGHEPVSQNRVYVPAYSSEPYGLQYPEEIRQMLVRNGTLNADLTPNEATAASLGWRLRERPAQGNRERVSPPAAPDTPDFSERPEELGIERPRQRARGSAADTDSMRAPAHVRARGRRR